ncbi:MAG: Hpt domain-containing protein [Butyrivibrio sp.]|uniref:Hpt domain-containing protein n=1 Tax=Butyrivibrio sp. TaxID=28121 RepID=UPI001B418555|nr:Hpt domain-containing protein [Butyrivibrio sp.]MBP3274058.1 Hpt domain-containing protein [Butyrivibrio sp.]MBP3782014.1 Hpt domain-containing protein [Butyrivibrio sp.]
MPEDKDVWLDQLKHVETADGIRYTGSKEAYLKFLRTFYATLEDKADEIEKSYKSGDMEFCTIKVHALKSTARIIGARELSKLAEKLEEAGKKKNFKIFDEHIYELLSMYRQYKEDLAGLPREQDLIKKEPISEDALSDAYDALRTFASQMDVDAVKMILDELDTYKLLASDEERIETINRKLLQFDWDGIEKLLQ